MGDGAPAPAMGEVERRSEILGNRGKNYVHLLEEVTVSSEVGAYLEARHRFSVADAKVTQYQEIVSECAGRLGGGRGAFFFSNVPTGLPPEVMMSSRSHRLDGNTWPTADQIQQAIAGWHEALRAMRTTYEGVPQHLREGLARPLGPV